MCTGQRDCGLGQVKPRLLIAGAIARFVAVVYTFKLQFSPESFLLWVERYEVASFDSILRVRGSCYLEAETIWTFL